MTSKKPATQDEAIEQAFVAGTLPEEDRRSEEDRRAPEVAPTAEADGTEQFTEPPPVVEEYKAIPNDQIHVVHQREDGVKVNALGSILE